MAAQLLSIHEQDAWQPCARRLGVVMAVEGQEDGQEDGAGPQRHKHDAHDQIALYLFIIGATSDLRQSAHDLSLGHNLCAEAMTRVGWQPDRITLYGDLAGGLADQLEADGHRLAFTAPHLAKGVHEHERARVAQGG